MSSPKRITFQSANSKGDGQGILFGDTNCKKPGLILMHEWWGLNEDIKKDGQRLADEGNFLVLVPDCYRGKVATTFEEAGHQMAGLDWEGATKDVQGAARYLLDHGCSKVGVTGFCMGGALAFLAATLPEISAVAPFYGVPRAQHGAASVIQSKVPMQMNMAKKDHTKGFASPEDYLPFKDRLVEAGANLEFHEYDAGHGFASCGSKGFDEAIAKLSLERMYSFMNKHLQ